MIFSEKSILDSKVAEVLMKGGIAVIPTDTIYGIVGSALRKSTVLRIYRLRKRNPKKPFIVLIPSLEGIEQFGASLKMMQKPVVRFLKGVWPGRVSVVLPLLRQGYGGQAYLKKFEYLHRGTGYIAFRVPAKKSLRELLQKTGPLVAPSANIEGKPSATTAKEAQSYFGENVDYYLDGGKIEKKASTVVKILEGKPMTMRK